MEVNKINLVFPNQLFENSPLDLNKNKSYIIEHDIFFKKFNFHKQKLLLHRSSMMFYFNYLKSKKYHIEYIENSNKFSDLEILFKKFNDEMVNTVNIVDPVDNSLTNRIKHLSNTHKIKLNIEKTPSFLTSDILSENFFKSSKKKFFQTSFYISQRKNLKILVNDDLTPIDGKWSFDADNRKKYPKDKIPPNINFPANSDFYQDSIKYVKNNFNKNIGEISDKQLYPTDFKGSKSWLDDFLKNRFFDFGIYEDAIVDNESFLNHSILTPMLNIGLLTPKYVIDKTLEFAGKNDVPINSVEGFIRQIIGWREFIKGIYISKGEIERTTNFFKFKRKIPSSFYDGSTGIEPIDTTIKKILKTGYAHHIERLMVLGNFMLLCEFDPDEVYRWFMELFVDSYDWVMVPNVYGMSQFADGGIMSTKPYFSSSNYIKKMSNYKKSNWETLWDALYWRFIEKNRDLFSKNIRMKFMVNMYDKMNQEKKSNIISVSENFLKSID